jgi:hypothetical protein
MRKPKYTIKHSNLNDDFFNFKEEQPIKLTELNLLLKDDPVYIKAVEVHGPLFPEYITTHINPNGFKIKTDNDVFLDHLCRTEFTFCKDLEICQQRINEAWHTQNYFRVFNKEFISSPDALKAYLSQTAELEKPKLPCAHDAKYFASTLEDESPFIEFFFDLFNYFQNIALFSYLSEIPFDSITLYGAVALFLTFLKLIGLSKNGYIFPSSLAIQVYTTTFKNFFHFGILKKSLHQRPV